jgi:hypothetical protein
MIADFRFPIADWSDCRALLIASKKLVLKPTNLQAAIGNRKLELS